MWAMPFQLCVVQHGWVFLRHSTAGALDAQVSSLHWVHGWCGLLWQLPPLVEMLLCCKSALCAILVVLPHLKTFRIIPVHFGTLQNVVRGSVCYFVNKTRHLLVKLEKTGSTWTNCFFDPIWQLRGFWQDRNGRKHIAQLYRPRVSYVLSHQIVKSFHFHDVR